jgi:hypothetical protein
MCNDCHMLRRRAQVGDRQHAAPTATIRRRKIQRWHVISAEGVNLQPWRQPKAVRTERKCRGCKNTDPGESSIGGASVAPAS